MKSKSQATKLKGILLWAVSISPSFVARGFHTFAPGCLGLLFLKGRFWVLAHSQWCSGPLLLRSDAYWHSLGTILIDGIPGSAMWKASVPTLVPITKK